MEISKELLGEVLCYKEDDYEILAGERPTYIKGKYLYYEYQDPHCSFETYITIKNSINIYELAFKLKIWAEEVFPEIYIATCIAENGEEWVAWSNNAQYIECYFYADTELEATIKACEWVLEKINEGK